VRQIKKSVSRLDTTSDIGLENLVNVLHHFAFGGEYQPNDAAKLDADTTNEPLVEEYCECSCDKAKAKASRSSLLHLSLSIGKAKANEAGGCEHAGKEYDEEEEDKQIKRKENLLQELLKIEKQLEVQKKQSLASATNSTSSRQSPKKEEASKATTASSASNYDHISMINKYLIKKCEYDLNRLYKTKLRALQQKPIEMKANEVASQPVKSAKKRLISSSSSSSPSSLVKADEDGPREEEKSESIKTSSITNTLMEFKKLSIDNIESGNSSSFSTIINQSGLSQNSKSTSISLSDIQPTLFFKSAPSKSQPTSSGSYSFFFNYDYFTLIDVVVFFVANKFKNI
jgi:hypothetical protein